MIVCHCAVVNDATIRAAIAAGSADVISLAATCGTSKRCGGCLPKVRDILAEHGLPTDDHLQAADIRDILRAPLPMAGQAV